jgi:hypothetical protein
MTATSSSSADLSCNLVSCVLKLFDDGDDDDDDDDDDDELCVMY